MTFFGKDPTLTPKTEAGVELTREEAERIFREIMNEVQEDLGPWIQNYLRLEHNPQKYGIMALFDKVLQRITFFYGAYQICSKNDTQTTKIVENSGLSKSEIAVCVAFLCHACEHQKVGDAVKSDLGERSNLKSVIKNVIEFLEQKGFHDSNVQSITIDDSYRVVIQLSSNLTKGYSLDW
jgi:hypothetical protein